jgi:hypothetical protein
MVMPPPTDNERPSSPLLSESELGGLDWCSPVLEHPTTPAQAPTAARVKTETLLKSLRTVTSETADKPLIAPATELDAACPEYKDRANFRRSSVRLQIGQGCADSVKNKRFCRNLAQLVRLRKPETGVRLSE